MKNQIVDRTEEKVKLAKEIGLLNWADMNDLIKMKFKPINEDKINIRLRDGVRYWSKKALFWDEPDVFMASFLGFIIGLAASFILGMISAQLGKNLIYETIDHRFLVMIPIAAISFGIIQYLKSGIRRISVASMRLTDWIDPLPYGAILAVKEAKEAGFYVETMRIYYPTARRERVLTDPIITAHRNEKLFEVFAWDDSKIYE